MYVFNATIRVYEKYIKNTQNLEIIIDWLKELPPLAFVELPIDKGGVVKLAQRCSCVVTSLLLRNNVLD